MAGPMVAGVGLWLFFKNGMPNTLFFRVPFAFLDYEKAGALVLLENVAMLLFWAFAGCQLAMLCRRKGITLMPIASFLEAFDFSGKRIVPFCSHGGGRFGQSLTAIAELAPEANMGQGLSVQYSGGATLSEDVAAWLEESLGVRG